MSADEPTMVVRRTPFEFTVNFQGLSGFDFPVASAPFRPICNSEACFTVALTTPSRWLCVRLVKHGNVPVRLSFKVRIEDHSKALLAESSQSPIVNFGIDKSVYAFERLYQLRPDLLSNVCVDSIRVTIVGVLVGDVEHIGSTAENREGVRTVADDLQRLLLEEGEDRDVLLTFPLDGDERQSASLRDHSFMLKLRSPVFRAILSEGAFQESFSKEIKIDDDSRDCFREMISFIYTDRCSMETNTFDLLHASRKYGVRSLETAVENFLLQWIDVANAADILFHADLYNAASLKERAICYIARNKECINVDGFFETINSPPLLMELLTALAKPDKSTAPTRKRLLEG